MGPLEDSTGEHSPGTIMTRYHRTDDKFDGLTTRITRFEYKVTEDRTTDHFHDERHDDKYLPDGDKPAHTNRIGADGGIQYPKRVVVEGCEVEFVYDSLGGEEVDTGKVFEVEYDADAGRITRIVARVHYDHAFGSDVEGFDVVHVIEVTGGAPTHVTCWLNRKADNNNRDGNTGTTGA